MKSISPIRKTTAAMMMQTTAAGGSSAIPAQTPIAEPAAPMTADPVVLSAVSGVDVPGVTVASILKRFR